MNYLEYTLKMSPGCPAFAFGPLFPGHVSDFGLRKYHPCPSECRPGPVCSLVTSMALVLPSIFFLCSLWSSPPHTLCSARATGMSANLGQPLKKCRRASVLTLPAVIFQRKMHLRISLLVQERNERH